MKIASVSVKENYGTKYDVNMSVEGATPEQMFLLMAKISAEIEFIDE